ncbi:MAG: O-antigen ligase family protein [Gammaproteobacteria bacterium]|nr:O-antigen ligase family protein [Gammaproteobacteria bacterium]
MLSINGVFKDFKDFYTACKAQDFAFYMLAAYLVFSYMRPHVIYPTIDFLPWTQLSILFGLAYVSLKGQIRFQLVHFVMILFFLVILASSYQSYYPDLSFKHLDSYYIWIIEVLFFTSCVRSLKEYRLLTLLFFLILFKMSLFGAKTWAERGFGFRDWGIAGPSGFFANSGEFSLLMAMLAVMSLAFILGHKEVKKIYYLLPITATMTVMGASSRGGQLALIVGLLIIAVAIGKLRIKNILIVAIAAFTIISLVPEEQKTRFSSAGEDGTSESRLEYWSAGLEMIDQNKLLGVGFNGFAQYFHDNYKEEQPDNYLSSRKEVAHNTFIQVGSTLGYLGLICYLWLLYLCYALNRGTRKLLKPNNKNHWAYRYAIGLDAALITYLVGSFFMSLLLYPYIYLMLMMSLSLKNCIESEVASGSMEDIDSTPDDKNLNDPIIK